MVREDRQWLTIGTATNACRPFGFGLRTNRLDQSISTISGDGLHRLRRYSASKGFEANTGRLQDWLSTQQARSLLPIQIYELLSCMPRRFDTHAAWVFVWNERALCIPCKPHKLVSRLRCIRWMDRVNEYHFSCSCSRCTLRTIDNSVHGQGRKLEDLAYLCSCSVWRLSLAI